MLKAMKIMVFFLLSATIFGCTAGWFTRVNSTAPSFGPIHVGITREQAERQLGYPIQTRKIDDSHYRIIYGYETERSNINTITTYYMDLVTFGLGNLAVSPIDRFNGSKHLMAIIYKVQDSYEENDRVIAIIEELQHDLEAITWVEKSHIDVQKRK